MGSIRALRQRPLGELPTGIVATLEVLVAVLMTETVALSKFVTVAERRRCGRGAT